MGEAGIGFKEFIESREVLKSLIKKELIGKYKNSALGFGWHFLMPFLMLSIYCVVFSTGMRASSIDNFIVYLLSALFPFMFLVSNISASTQCITSNTNLVKKLFFPRSYLVFSQVISSFITSCIGYSVSLLIILISGYPLKPLMLMQIPIILLFEFLFISGYAFLMSSLNVYFRDIQHLFSAISIMFMFLTPIYFKLESITYPANIIVSLNPFTYFVESLHMAVYEGSLVSINNMLTMATMSVLILVVGFTIFHKLEKGFVERL